MADPNQPRENDVILGGDLAGDRQSLPLHGVMLGGLEGVQRLFNSADERHRVDALFQAINHGKAGLDLVIKALTDPSDRVQWAAYDLLRDRPEKRIKQRLATLFFTSTGMNYRPLVTTLAARKWRKAEHLTVAILRELCLVSDTKRITSDRIVAIACEDLLMIDRLWRQYSNDRFGLSVQVELWQKCDRARWDQADAWILFGRKVGWRSGNFLTGDYHWKRPEELTFSLRAPKGHLPFISGINTIEAISDRFDCCQHPSYKSLSR
ncbi:GUN4 domain protein [Thalassoporum mexicanum PCC 7367]|uniref:GUN4 domain-containing protein n=1 Tax=Thalassoporum mexicanum TaxID=3457544 RepID=UPI00029F8C16|nr:GUN4 domain-containing protein [Pseudanabaena sp. PCC 7367]AFY71661.1 GUN4 domain protein [Pseudanabaena sp. PCC 7367]